jgi:NADPH-dependent 2,4-dienoyl-CoA reductase/sulfur reductase-like enzyme
VPLERIVVVGASLAGLRAAEALRRAGYERELTIVGDEPHRPYNRPPLSKELLAGKVDDCAFRVDDEQLACDWRLGVPAASLDLRARQVVLGDGGELPFDGLIVATGARARTWPGAGEGVHVLRTLDDALALRAALVPGARLVIVGAGFVGCEVAATARGLGCEVTLVDVAPLPMGPLGPEIGALCARLHREHGVDLRLGEGVAAVEDRSVVLAGGARITGDAVLVAIGAVPCTAWLAGSGLTLDPGVVCDERCAAVGAEGVYAAGDVAHWPHPLLGGELVRVEHWSNAGEMARAAARNLLGDDTPYAAVPYFWSDQYDVKVQAVGFPERGERAEVVEGDPDDGAFITALERDGVLVGALLWNMPRRMPHYRRWVAERVPAADVRAAAAG